VIEVLNKINGEVGYDDKDLLQAIATSVCIALENARLYKETVSMAEHERDVRHMFQKFVPKEVLDKILHGSANGKPIIEEIRTITLLNIDIRGFSRLALQIGSQKTVSLLNSFSRLWAVSYSNTMASLTNTWVTDSWRCLAPP
jgi:hypothetical protein